MPQPLAPARPAASPFTWDVDCRSIPRRFERQVRESPDAVAVIDGPRRVTYAELNRRANVLARRIVAALGPAPAPVALLFDLEADVVIAIYAALKARKFYVPLDPHLPPRRLRHAIAHTGARLIVAGHAHAERATTLVAEAGQILTLIEDDHAGDDDLDLGVEPDDLAYVMYTSGSTGDPKGVMHSHRTLLFDMWRQGLDLRVTAGDVYGLLFAASSSASCCSIFGALLNGAAMSCLDLHRRSVAAIGDWLEQDRITICDITVAALRLCAASLDPTRRFPAMRLIAPGGEPVYRSDVDLCRRLFPDAIVQNSLGTTETRTATQFFLDRETALPEAAVPIGWPVHGKAVLLLDDDRREAVEGEIAIRSRYLSPGYWRDPALTARAFHPVGDAGETIYFTGDVGRRLADGRLLHLGRKDQQVKVRGYRVEIGEVESLLLSLPDIDEAVVVAEPQATGGVRLVAYVASRERLRATVLRAACAAALPSYAVPAEFRRVAALPKTSNGKLARNRVPALEGERLADDRASPTAPRTDRERTIAAIFADVLDGRCVGVDDDFFEAGGDSLRALDCAARLERTFGVRLSMTRFVEAPTVAGISALISTHDTAHADLPCLRPGPDDARLYFLPAYYGTVAPLRELAQRIDAAFSVYGIENTDAAHTADMVAIAAAHARTLDEFQPRGPFRLVGHSFGGMLAYEVARQLRDRGRDVVFVGIVDWAPPDPAANAAANRTAFLRNVVPSLRDNVRRGGLRPLLLRGARTARKAAWRLARRASGRGRAPEPAVRPDQLHEYWLVPDAVRPTAAGCLAASLAYRPPPTDLPIWLFVARIRPLFHSIDPARAWRRLTPHVRATTVRGNHVTVIDPSRSDLADAINASLRASAAAPHPRQTPQAEP